MEDQQAAATPWLAHHPRPTTAMQHTEPPRSAALHRPRCHPGRSTRLPPPSALIARQQVGPQRGLRAGPLLPIPWGLAFFERFEAFRSKLSLTATRPACSGHTPKPDETRKSVRIQPIGLTALTGQIPRNCSVLREPVRTCESEPAESTQILTRKAPILPRYSVRYFRGGM